MTKCRFTYTHPIVDKTDEATVHPYCWYIDQRGYVTAWIPKVQEHQTLHIFLLGRPPRGKSWDHINQNKQDNRRSNLRLASKSLQAMNSKRRSDNSTGVRGVSKRRNGFRAYVTIGGKTTYLGDFPTLAEASQARKSWEGRNHA